jgi:hypothetical protein
MRSGRCEQISGPNPSRIERTEADGKLFVKSSESGADGR